MTSTQLPLYLPDISELPRMDYMLTLNLGFWRYTRHELSISRLNAERGLVDPDSLIKEIRETVEASKTLYSSPPPRLHEGVPVSTFLVMAGHWKPMQSYPWHHEFFTESDYLTVVEKDPYKGVGGGVRDAVGIRHYITLRKHNEALRDAQTSVKHIVRDQVIEGVNEAVETSSKRIKELEHEIAKRDKVIAELKAKLNGQPRSRAGYVYLLKNKHEADIYKIGKTNNPSKRVDRFEVKLPFPVELEHLITTDDRHALESELHERYAAQRLDGEWFRLTPDDVAYIKGL